MEFLVNIYIFLIIKIVLCQSSHENESFSRIEILDYKYDAKIYKQTKRSFRDKEEKIFYKLEKELRNLIRYNNSLISNFEHLEYTAIDNHKYANELSKRHFSKFFNSTMINILYITKSYKRLFIKENKWLFSKIFSKLQNFIKDPNQSKQYKYIEETEEYLKNYNEIINELYEISVTAERIYYAEYKYLDRETFEYILLFLKQFNETVKPSIEIIESSKKCCKYFNELDKTKYKIKKSFSFLNLIRKLSIISQ